MFAALYAQVANVRARVGNPNTQNGTECLGMYCCLQNDTD